MLQQMREMKMVIFWFVAVTFLVGFVFLGGLDVPQLDRGRSDAVAVVNGREIPYDQYSRLVARLGEDQRRSSNRDELSVAEWDRIEQQAWDNLVTEILMSQEARRLGIQVPDDEILGILTTNPPEYIRQRFTDDGGNFDQAAYQRAVADPNYDWKFDEQFLRNALPVAKLQQMVRARAQVSEAEVHQEWERRTLQTKVQYVGVPWGSIELPGDAPEEADLRAFYAAHPELFARPETVTLDVLRFEKKPSADDQAEVMDDAREVLQQLEKGETFAALAEIYSDDASAARGGQVGWVDPSSLLSPVQEAAQALAPGATSDILHSERGLVLVHVDSARAQGTAREVFLRQIVLEARPSEETLDSLRALVLEAGDEDFAAAGRKLGVEPQRLESVERHGFIPSLGFAPRLAEWAFAAQPGAVSPPLALETSWVIARLVAKDPKRPLPFEEVRDRVVQERQTSLKKARARARVLRVLEHVRAGQSLAAAARAEGLRLEDPAPFKFYDYIPDVGSGNEFSAAALALAPGQVSGALETPLGAFALQVLSRVPADQAAYAQQRESHYQSLLQQREMQVFEAWVEDLKKRAEIRDRRPPRV